MRILVTGGAGFIGSNLVHTLLHGAGALDGGGCCPGEPTSPAVPDDIRVLNVDKLTYAGDLRNLPPAGATSAHRHVRADICDAANLRRLATEFEPDTILHLAAESHVDRSIASGAEFVRTNVAGTQAVLDVARACDIRRMIHVSTDEVYGSRGEGSFSEEEPCSPSSPYSASKAASDLLALAHHRTYGLPVIVTRCTNNYGPRQHVEKLVPKTISLAARGERIPVYGNGQNVRDWLHVSDHCSALLQLLERGQPGAIYNIAGREERRNIDLVREILEMASMPESLIEFVPDRLGHDLRYSVDDRKLRSLGWAPRVSLQEGLGRTIAYYGERWALPEVA